MNEQDDLHLWQNLITAEQYFQKAFELKENLTPQVQRMKKFYYSEYMKVYWKFNPEQG